MNDPHVESLVYKVRHGESIDYDKAVPLELQTAEFHLIIDKGKATFRPIQHFAAAQDAQLSIEPFIKRWELDVLLRMGPDSFRLEYETAHVIDRSPIPDGGIFAAQGVARGSSRANAIGRASHAMYPAPPPPSMSLEIDGDIEVMQERYRWFRSDKEPIAATAYFCVTMLESEFQAASSKPRKPSGPRKQAAEKCFIDLAVLEKAGELSSEKGGTGARKAGGVSKPLTDAEGKWLDAAMKMMIRRFAEYKADAKGPYPQITMAHLPKLK